MKSVEAVHRFQKIVTMALIAFMAVVLFFATLDLGVLIVGKIASPPVLRFEVEKLLEIFGLCLLVLIGIELLESIVKTYLIEGTVHVEIVLGVAIIAVARKVIILDIDKLQPASVVGLAAVILALCTGYYFVRKTRASADREPGPPPAR